MSQLASNPAPSGPGYETRDVNIRAVLWLCIGVAACTVVVAAVLWLLVKDFQRRAQRLDAAPSPRAALQEAPPAPRLQEAPVADYREFRAREDELLSTYGWVDKQKGTVRIPIERAMELLVERGEEAVSGPSSSEEEKTQ